jgi:hypothetical protein
MSTQTITEVEVQTIQKINQMSRVEMAHAWRFTPAGDPMFMGQAGEVFEQRFRSLGGFSSDISKQIEW